MLTDDYENFAEKISKLEDTLVGFFAKSNQRLDNLEMGMQVYDKLRNTQKALWGLIGGLLGFVVAVILVIMIAYV